MDESWDQIGKRLRDARDRSDMTVDDVVYRTRIPRSIVEALEAEDFSVFTSPTYAKSFLRQYSEFLKVDADPWLSALEPGYYVSGESVQPMFGVSEEAPAARRSSPRESRKSESYATTTSASGKWSALLAMFLTACLGLAIFGGYKFLDQKFANMDPVKPAATPVPPAVTKPVPAAAPIPVGTHAVSLSPEDVKKEETPGNPPRAIIVRD